MPYLAQNIAEDKAKKVLLDVGRAMFSEQFLGELFKPQETYTISATKQIFEKLAHSSIMRLNRSSMDKLFDLMTMGFKYQLLQCNSPQQYMHLTLHHLETMTSLVGSASFTDMVQNCINQFIKTYAAFTHGQWLRLSHTLLRFVQGRRVKVSLFLQHQMQANDGTIIFDSKGVLPYGTEVPGYIRFFEGENIVSSRVLCSDSKMEYSESPKILHEDSIIGTNMYAKNFKPETKSCPPVQSTIVAARALAEGGFAGSDFKAQAKSHSFSSAAGSSYSSITASSAKAELNMLADLLGIAASSPSKESVHESRSFKINLFPNISGDSKDSEDGGGMIVLDIDASADAKSLQSYLEDLDFDDDPKASRGDAKNGSMIDDDDDLLALMDSAK